MHPIYRTIQAFLYPNPMKNAKGKYLARTLKHATCSIADICTSLASKSGSAVNADTMEYHAKILLEEIMEHVMDGKKVDCGYFTVQANIKGSFNSLHDNFDPNKHGVEIVFSSTKKTIEKAKNLTAEISHGNPFNYGIWNVEDGRTKQRTYDIQARALLTISGGRIKITGDDPATGIYFTNTDSSIETKVQPNDIFENGNTIVKILVPDLNPGSYKLTIVTQYSGNTTPLNQARTLAYGHLLQVE